MPNKKWLVTARFKVKPEQLTAFLSLCSWLAEMSRQEPGCLSYSVFQDVESPETVCLIEEYRDENALEFHKKQPYLDEFRQKRTDCLLEKFPVRAVSFEDELS